MCKINFISLFLFYLIQSTFICADESKIIRYSTAKQWAEKFGVELYSLGEFITRKKDVVSSFQKAQIVPRSGNAIAEEIAKDIKKMMNAKISAIKRIVDAAQEIGSISASNDEVVERNFTYYNSKEFISVIEPSEVASTDAPPMNDGEDSNKHENSKPVMFLAESEKFNDYINLSLSSVHVPANVYDRAKNVIKAIKWSTMLDDIFDNNYKRDPSLYWQYFCSSTGFLRQFPATKWKWIDPVDLYDCRIRHWYIEAANSPKDVVILIDNSGSMTGQKKDIARHIAENILDTLTANDFVNIFTFSHEIDDLITCFGDQLVQANSANVRVIKEKLNKIETNELANFSAAMTKAFDALNDFRDTHGGANCNQAIMLISDGLPITVDEIFEVYNWRDKPNIPVRVFTYLIGREVPDVTNIKNMACENRGFYTHLSTHAEVREQVLEYIPVMARPLVLNRTHHPILWSQVYADVIDPQFTDYEWEVRERASQRDRFMAYRKDKNIHTLPDDPSTLAYEIIETDESELTKKFNFMTTVSIPVYDKRDNANITEEFLINEAYWVTVTRETRIANLLGVAGTDIPIVDIKELMQPFLLGVGAYAFIVDNNGLILIHPDFRPVFYKDILKPAYNSVDFVDVEFVDDDREPRDYDPLLVEIREKVINQSTGFKSLNQKFHLDKMKRVSRQTRDLYFTGLDETPFTLVLSIPTQYGKYRLQTPGDDEIHRETLKGTNVLNFFNGSNWKIHPDWLYCKHSNETFLSPEAELTYFLERMRQPRWHWPLNRSPPPPEQSHAKMSGGSQTNSTPERHPDKDSYYCDRNLMQSLVYDAKMTEWFSRNASTGVNEGNEFKQRFGVSVSFLATHSGLLRWQDYNTINDEIRPENEFSETNKRAIDETWYKRAVEQHFIEPNSFVYAVPFDAANKNDTLVTATHAIFHKDKGTSAPAAVVGFQFQQTKMATLFKNITSSCTDASCATCASDEFECFVLDDNGYVVISDPKEEISHVGRFFGEVRGNSMRKMIDEKIYQEVKIYDYQAICFINKDSANLASTLAAPFKFFWSLFRVVAKHMIWLYLSLLVDNIYGMDSNYDDDDYVYPTENSPGSKMKEQEFDRQVLIMRTRPERCDKTFLIYQLTRPKEKSAFDYGMQSNCKRPYIVIPIPSTNMVLYVGSTLCNKDDSEGLGILSNQPVEVDYNGTMHCHIMRTMPAARKSLKDCFTNHVNESQIEICGNAHRFHINFVTLVLASILVNLSNYFN